MNSRQYIELQIERAWLERACTWAARRVDFTVDRHDLPARTVGTKMDHHLMGEVSSIAVAVHLQQVCNKRSLCYDKVRRDESRERDHDWDVVVGDGVRNWGGEGDDISTKPPNSLSFSVKSSVVPRRCHDDLAESVSRYDFKVLKYQQEIGQDLLADYVVQVYFKWSDVRDGFHVPSLAREIVERARSTNGGDRDAIDTILRKLQAEKRYRRCWIVGFLERQRLIDYSNSLPAVERVTAMQVGGECKMIWRAPLRIGTTRVPCS